MLRLTLRNLAAHKRRLIGTSLAVCLGVAFLAGTFVLGDTMAANFDRLFSSSIGNTDAVVRNDARVGGDIETAQALVPQATVARVATVDGVAASAPEIEGFVSNGNTAMAMGNVHLMNKAGEIVTVDKSFGYTRGKDGELRIVLHHSSLPYNPK